MAGKAVMTILAAGLAALLAVPASAGTADMGIYGGAGPYGARKIQRFEAWLGRKVPRALDFFSYKSWADLQEDSAWSLKSWRGGRWQMVFAIPLLPTDGSSTLAEGAAGAYDDEFRKLARRLVANGFGDAVLRVGWEFNGDWYPWAAAKCPSCFVAYWRRVVTVMRAAPGAHFRFDWNANLGSSPLAPEKVYPGDAYVDIIGLDVYNQSWDPESVDAPSRWRELLAGDHGLEWHRRFAATHGKPMSYPEWGTGTRPDGHGAGDDPYFIARMAAWLAANDVVYHIYWDYPAKDYNAELSRGQYPKAGAAFRQSFGPR
jgi:hypothetical protein